MVHLCIIQLTTSATIGVGGGAAQREGGVGRGSRQRKCQDAGEQRGVGCSDQAAGPAAVLTTQAAGHARAGMHSWRIRKPDIWYCRTKCNLQCEHFILRIRCTSIHYTLLHLAVLFFIAVDRGSLQHINLSTAAGLVCADTRLHPSNVNISNVLACTSC